MTTNEPTLSDLQNVLSQHQAQKLRMVLPDGSAVPSHFHVTEVGRVQKDFIDCGGTRRRALYGQLQLLVATDYDHRLSAQKLLKIIEMSQPILGDEPLPLTVEYGQKVAVVYHVAKIDADHEVISLTLITPQTGCLAPDTCGLAPEESGLFKVGASTCTPNSGCC